MGKYNDYIALFSKLLVGITFIVSAILKGNSIDEFELYIFSFNIFSLNIAALVARLVIGFELMLGVGYIVNIYHKYFYYALFASLIAFTIFLTTLVFIGNEDNCHCFGDLVDISPMESIIKNIVLIAILFLSRNTPKWEVVSPRFFGDSSIDKYKKYILVAICFIMFVPFVQHPHHSNFRSPANVKGINRQINVELFNDFLEQNPQLGWGTECKILAFYGTHCKHCKMSAKVLSQIVKNNNLSTDAIHFLFWGADEGVEQFLQETTSGVPFDYSLIHPKVLLEITNGEIPTLLFYDENAEHKFIIHNVRSLDENDMVKRLSAQAK